MKSEEILSAFYWPKAIDVDDKQATPLHKHDELLSRIERLIDQGKAWAPINGSTKRCESDEKLTKWIAAQNATKATFDAKTGTQRSASLALNQFPVSEPGKRVITTARNIAYIVDSTDVFVEVVGEAFGAAAMEAARRCLDPNIGVFLYVTNSIEAGGRAFSGDPFTGQAAAYSWIFARDFEGTPTLNFVGYYPHQLYSQFFTAIGAKLNNKGVKMLSANARLLITCSGVMLEPSSWKLVS